MRRPAEVAEVDHASFVQSLYSFRLLGDAPQLLPNSALSFGIGSPQRQFRGRLASQAAKAI
jgi:hypothetical protein